MTHVCSFSFSLKPSVHLSYTCIRSGTPAPRAILTFNCHTQFLYHGLDVHSHRSNYHAHKLQVMPLAYIDRHYWFKSLYTRDRNFVLPLPPPFPESLPPSFFFLLNFLLLQAQAPLHRVCRPLFLPCLFSGLIGLLDQTISTWSTSLCQTQLNTCPSTALIGPTYFQRHLLLLILATLRRIMTCTRLSMIFFHAIVIIIEQPSSDGVLWAFVPFSLFFLLFFIFRVFCGPGLLSWGCE